jgi:hypothetical protein
MMAVVPAPGTRENRRCLTILASLLRPAIFVGTRIAGTQYTPTVRIATDPAQSHSVFAGFRLSLPRIKSGLARPE